MGASGAPFTPMANWMARGKATIDAALGEANFFGAKCGPDIKLLCSDVTPGEGRMLACLVEHNTNITMRCYGALVDLTDDVSEALHRPFAAISIEMVYRSLYYFTKAHERGETDDLVTYLVANTKLLGIVKRKPPPSKLDALFDLTTVSGA